jgi:hypothetical protein
LALIESLLDGTAEGPSVEIAVAKPDRRDLSMTTFLIDMPNGADMTGVLIRDVTEERDLERRRDTFYRVKNEQTYEIRGTGLGLYIVKSLVEGIGGTLNVESEVGVGSTFSFTMPASLSGSTLTQREENEQSLIG